MAMHPPAVYIARKNGVRSGKNGFRSRKATSMEKWCQVPQSDIDELFIYKFVGPSSLCAKNLDSEYTLG
jgi:hypothetical protein